ncbi:MAG: RNA polymerase sporulation sigma factor SigK [Clostridia bacterium]|nr:RNA polymerase sporulation sigma factor SigK [Clostridia bacterium]
MVFENFVIFMNKILLFSSYIITASGFPKPLTLEDEKKYFARFRNGDKKAKDILINHNLRLVAHIVKKYSGAGEADDLLSVGSIGLIKAINSFEYDKGTQLSTYAARCIENEILMLLRANKKHKNIVSLQETIGEENGDGDVELMNVIPSMDEDLFSVVEDNIFSEKILRIVNKKLPEREAQIVKMRYGLENQKPLTQREVACKLGISRSYISRLETKALETIKKEV